MNRITPANWLRCLLFIHLVSIANSLISWLPVGGTLTTWISSLILLSVTVVMFGLAQTSDRYQKSGICRAVWFGCRLINALLPAPALFALAASLLSIVAVYEEYAGHAKIITEKDPKLSLNWNKLFGWSILVSVLTSLVSTVVAILILATDADVSAVQSIVMAILNIAELAVDGFYLWYLIRTIRLVEPEI